MTKEEIEDILSDMDVETEPGGAGWVSTRVVDKTADIFVSAMDEYYNQAIDDAIKLVNGYWDWKVKDVTALRQKLESLKKKQP